MSLAAPASERAASAASAVEPVTTAGPALATAIPPSVPTATNTVRVLSSGMARPARSVAIAQRVTGKAGAAGRDGSLHRLWPRGPFLVRSRRVVGEEADRGLEDVLRL